MLDESYLYLGLAAETLDDIESARVAAENRARALWHPEQRIGLPKEHEAVLKAEGIAQALLEQERKVIKEVEALVLGSPVGAWCKRQKGIGAKQLGRLLGQIGDPYRRYDAETGEISERTIAQLWSFCGYAVHNGQAPRPVRGAQLSYNPDARKRAFVIAASCIKQMGSPYRVVYDDARTKYADAIHASECKRCGPSGKPAQPGSPLSDGHKHARAMRLTAKAILKDLWLAAEGHPSGDSHVGSALTPAQDSEWELVAA